MWVGVRLVELCQFAERRPISCCVAGSPQRIPVTSRFETPAQCVAQRTQEQRKQRYHKQDHGERVNRNLAVIECAVMYLNPADQDPIAKKETGGAVNQSEEHELHNVMIYVMPDFVREHDFDFVGRERQPAPTHRLPCCSDFRVSAFALCFRSAFAPGINVVSASELAGEMGPIEFHAHARAVTGRAGLFPSRYQSDEVDRADGPLAHHRNARLRAAWLRVADNLIKCNAHYRGKNQLWIGANARRIGLEASRKTGRKNRLTSLESPITSLLLLSKTAFQAAVPCEINQRLER